MLKSYVIMGKCVNVIIVNELNFIYKDKEGMVAKWLNQIMYMMRQA